MSHYRRSRGRVGLYLVVSSFVAIVSANPTDGGRADDRGVGSGTIGVASGISGPIGEAVGADAALSPAGSAILARQVLDGAPFDAVILADPTWMDLLEDEGRLQPGTRGTLGVHRLVLAAANPGSSGALEAPVDLLAVADPLSAPLGAATGQAVASLGGIDRLARGVVVASDARAVAAMVASGVVDAGIIYATDARPGSGLRVVRRFDSADHDPVAVEIAALRGSSRGPGLVARLMSEETRGRLADAGLQPFREVASDSRVEGSAGVGIPAGARWWRPVMISLRVAAVAVVVMLPPGIAIAWWLARSRSRWTALVEALVDLPLVLPPVVVGYLLLRMIGRSGAIGGILHDHFGVDLAFTWWAAAIASGVMGFPLLVRSARPAIASVDRDLERAAANAGAGRFRTFRKVTLPLAAPGIIAGGTLAFARSLGEFGATVLVAGNVPGETRTLALAIWSETRVPGREAEVLTLVVVAVGLSIAATLLSEWLARRARHRP